MRGRRPTGARAERSDATTGQALSELNRDLSGRARYRFRRDAKRQALFGSYSVERAGGRKKAPAPEPASVPAKTVKPTP